MTCAGDYLGGMSMRAWVLLFLLNSSAALAQTVVQWGPVVDVAPGPLDAQRPRIALNAAGEAVVIWGDVASSANMVAVGGEQGFSAPQRLQPLGLNCAVADWMGSSIAADGDEVWAVFKALPEETRSCYVMRSTDGGHTWGDTLRVDPYDGLVSRFPSIAVGPLGPVVQYMQFTEGYEEPRQVVSRYVDGVFQPPVQVSTPFSPGEVCDCCTGEVLAEGSSAVALYRNAGNNQRVIWAAASTDSADTFTEGAAVDATAWSYNACPSSGPDGYLAEDSIRHVWMSGALNGTKVHFGSAAVATLEVGRNAPVHAGQALNLQQNFPRIAGHLDTLGIVWQQTYQGQVEVLFAYATDGGTLGAPDTVNVVTQGAQRTPDVAFAQGVFHFVWRDVGTLRYRSARLVDATSMDEMTVSQPPMLWPQPALDHFRWMDARHGVRTVRLFAPDGRIVKAWPASASYDLPAGIASGIYRCVAFTALDLPLASTALLVSPRP